jgi:hypothetical protein
LPFTFPPQAFLRSVCVPDRAVEALTASDLRILQFNRSYVVVAGYLQHTFLKLREVRTPPLFKLGDSSTRSLGHSLT